MVKKMKSKSLIWIIPVIIIVIVLAVVAFRYAVEEMFYAVLPSELIIDMNQDCVVMVDAPWAPTAQQECVYYGHLDAPVAAENLTFYISIEGEPNQGTSRKSFKVEVWNGASWEELFYKELTAIEGGQETTQSEIPGTIIKQCDGSAEAPCYGAYFFKYACETVDDLPTERLPSYSYDCVFFPDCFNSPKDSYNRYFCTMPVFRLDKSYIINNQVKFRTTGTLLIGSGDATVYPVGSEAISITNVNFGFIDVLIDVYRFENNQCSFITILKSEKAANDYLTLGECEENILQIKQTYYRFENNMCSEIELYPNETTVNDYLILVGCEENIVGNGGGNGGGGIPLVKQIYYRLENNQCSEIELYPSEATVNDYLTLSDCEQEILVTMPTKKTFWSEYKWWVITALTFLIILGVIVFKYVVRKK